MAASKRTRARSEASNQVRLQENAIEDLCGRVLPNSLEGAAEQYRKQASKALANNHPVEEAICRHLAGRLSTPIKSADELSQLLAECKELSLFLPISENLRKYTRIERKAFQVRSLRNMRLNKKNEDWLIKSELEKPGRPAEAREVAVRAMELQMTGQRLSQIEGVLLPHRLNVANPGRSINREVQFLKGILRRYKVL